MINARGRADDDRRVCIRVGDMSNSRKAWKKRRHNASPLLLPCGVMGIGVDAKHRNSWCSELCDRSINRAGEKKSVRSGMTQLEIAAVEAWSHWRLRGTALTPRAMSGKLRTDF